MPPMQQEQTTHMKRRRMPNPTNAPTTARILPYFLKDYSTYLETMLNQCTTQRHFQSMQKVM